jgi:hypothetical protein
MRYIIYIARGFTAALSRCQTDFYSPFSEGGSPAKEVAKVGELRGLTSAAGADPNLSAFFESGFAMSADTYGFL